MNRFSFILVASAALVMPALAAETPWQDLLPNVRMRLIADPVLPGARMASAALEIEMPDSFRTYWKVPGEAGIAPQIDVSGSSGVTGADIVFPLPKVQIVGGFVDYTYEGNVILPIQVTLDGVGRPRLSVSALLGICDDLCMPANGVFKLDLDEYGLATETEHALSTAFAAVPAGWPFPDPAIAGVEYQAEGNGLLLTLGYDGVDKRSIIATVDGAGTLFGQAEAVADPAKVFVPIASGKPVVAGQPVTLVFASDMGNFEVVVPNSQ